MPGMKMTFIDDLKPCRAEGLGQFLPDYIFHLHDFYICQYLESFIIALHNRRVMPKIYLKPKSPEFADDGKKTTVSKHCDMPGCSSDAAHKAPKDRGLQDYYWFCADHIQEYNKAWDFFSGMNQSDIEDHITRSFLWDRPTRRFDAGNMEEKLKQRAWETRYFTDDDSDRYEKGKGFRFSSDPHVQATPEVQAMAVMDLQPPLDITIVKTRYKQLVKKYHPDVNHGDPKAEETIKSINMAYTILKLAYEKYDANYKD